MRGARMLSLSALIFVTFACASGEKGPDTGGQLQGQGDRRPGQAASSPATAARPAQASAAEPLGEFETLTQADVDLYLKVLRAAAERVRNMPQADRDVLNAFHKMTTGGAGQIPTPDQMAAMQRAGDLMTIPSGVAREMGVEKRFSSIGSRVEHFLMPMDGASSGDEDDAARMTAEERAALKVRIQRFRDRRTADAATLQPYRDEIAALQKQVDFARHPESIPK